MTGGFEFYASLLRSLRGELILCSALLFLLGLLCAPFVVKNDFQPLLRYPRWMWRLIRHWLQPQDRFAKMMMTIAFLNGSSLLVNVLSGLFGVLPFIFAFLVGLHVGVIVIEESGGLNLVGMLLNPVAFIELPATWISLSLGMELGLFQFQGFSLSGACPFLRHGLLVYGTLIVPLLLVAAFIEVLLIKWGLRFMARKAEEECSDRRNY